MCGKELRETTQEDLNNSQTELVDMKNYLYCTECANKIDDQVREYRKTAELIKERDRIAKKYEVLAKRSYMSQMNTFSLPQCLDCASNPANGGNGICWCKLATPEIT